jgi:hypothetical protein
MAAGRLTEPSRTIESLVLKGDSLGDQVAEFLIRSGELARTHDSFKALESRLAGLPADSDEAEAYRAFLAHYEAVPSWVDFDRLRLGQEIFLRHPIISALVNFVAGWLEVYSAPFTARVLLHTGRQSGDIWRRVSETNQMYSDMSAERAMEPGGVGNRMFARVRLMHSGVRLLVRQSGHWRDAGDPISQTDLARSLTIFTEVHVRGMQTMGLRLTEREKDAYHHLWQYAGYLLGIEPELITPSYAEHLPLYRSLREFRVRPDDNCRLLVKLLFENVGGKIPYVLPVRALEALGCRLLGEEYGAALGIRPHWFWSTCIYLATPLFFLWGSIWRLLFHLLPGARALNYRVAKGMVNASQRGQEAQFKLPYRSSP